MSEPTYIPIYPESLEEAQNPANGAMMGTEECFRHYAEVRTMDPRRENKITLQSLFHVMRAEPKDYVRLLSAKPLMMVVSLRDSLIDP